MKLTFAIVCLLTASILAADNDQAASKWQSESRTNQIRMRTTDTNGVHTPHVIVSATSSATITVATPTITSAASSGSVTAGSRGVTFIFSDDFTGTILGAPFTGVADGSLRIVPPSGASLAAIAYTITAGNIRILDVR